MLRPSMRTRSFAELTLLKPRELTSHALAVVWLTWRPGASRSASGIERDPERRMSSPVISATAAAASVKRSSVLETMVTSTSRSCSRLSDVRSFGASEAEPAAARITVTAATAKPPQRTRRARNARALRIGFTA